MPSTIPESIIAVLSATLSPIGDQEIFPTGSHKRESCTAQTIRSITIKKTSAQRSFQTIFNNALNSFRAPASF